VVGLALIPSCPVCAWAQQWGDLTGRFVYDGTPPTPKGINVTKDADVFGKLGLVDESLVVSKDGGLANVVIYVRTRNVPVHPDIKVDQKITLDNMGGRFVPRITVLWLPKQIVSLANSDPVAHNSNIQPIGDTGVNPLLPPMSAQDYKLNRVQTIPVPVSCNIHPWMRGYVLPRDNPYFAVTGPDGTFKIEKLPAGKLEFQDWHEKAGYLALKEWKQGRFELEIKPGANDLGTKKVDPALLTK
jgi:hypothetical protein